MKFEEYYRDITEKFFDSLQMFLTAVLNKTSNTEEIGKKLIENKDYSETDICFVLVIENATDPAWLAGPKAELDERLKKLRKIWGVKVVVLNHELAIECGLVKYK